MRPNFLLLILMASLMQLLLASGCRKPTPPTPTKKIEASGLPKITINAKAKMLFTYSDEKGVFKTVDSLDKVPEDLRGWVRVVDLSQKYEQRVDLELVYVADLCQKQKDDSYSYIVMSRQAFEETAICRGRDKDKAKAASSQPTNEANAQVILYSTSWCPACRAAKDYLIKEKIPFVEKDIEKDQAAATELLAKAKAQGFSASGVPVLDVRGTLMQGFDPQAVQAHLGDKK